MNPERISGLDCLETLEVLQNGYTVNCRRNVIHVRESFRRENCCNLQLRLECDDDDPEFASHIGCSVCPSERGREYENEQLRTLLR